MCKIRNVSPLIFSCLLIFVSAQTQAAAISVADVVFDWRTLTIENANGDSLVIVGANDDNEEFLVDTSLAISNDLGSFSQLVEGEFEEFSDLSSFNVSSTAGYSDFDDSYGATAIADSIFSDLVPATAEANSIVYVPFGADGDEATVFFSYDLFSSAQALLMGDFALSISTIGFSLLDEFFDEVALGSSDQLLSLAIDGEESTESLFNNFQYTFFNLTDGSEYLLAIDSFAFSSTESIPEPTTLLIFLLGMIFIAKNVGRENNFQLLSTCSKPLIN